MFLTIQAFAQFEQRFFQGETVLNQNLLRANPVAGPRGQAFLLQTFAPNPSATGVVNPAQPVPQPILPLRTEDLLLFGNALGDIEQEQREAEMAAAVGPIYAQNFIHQTQLSDAYQNAEALKRAAMNDYSYRPGTYDRLQYEIPIYLNNFNRNLGNIQNPNFNPLQFQMASNPQIFDLTNGLPNIYEYQRRSQGFLQ